MASTMMTNICGIDYAAVFDGSHGLAASYPQFALWATNISPSSTVGDAKKVVDEILTAMRG